MSCGYFRTLLLIRLQSSHLHEDGSSGLEEWSRARRFCHSRSIPRSTGESCGDPFSLTGKILGSYRECRERLIRIVSPPSRRPQNRRRHSSLHPSSRPNRPNRFALVRRHHHHRRLWSKHQNHHRQILRGHRILQKQRSSTHWRPRRLRHPAPPSGHRHSPSDRR